MSDFTRRGFMGLIAAAPVAAMVPFKFKPLPSPAKVHAENVEKAFAFDVRTGPPFEVGDVLLKESNGELFLVKATHPPPMFGLRGTGQWESDPLFAVPVDNPDSGVGIPLKNARIRGFKRVGTAYNEGKDFPR